MLPHFNICAEEVQVRNRTVQTRPMVPLAPAVECETVVELSLGTPAENWHQKLWRFKAWVGDPCCFPMGKWMENDGK